MEDKKCPSVESGKIKAKQCVPLRRIVGVDYVKDDDAKKFKKLSKAHDLSFKVNYFGLNDG